MEELPARFPRIFQPPLPLPFCFISCTGVSYSLAGWNWQEHVLVSRVNRYINVCTFHRDKTALYVSSSRGDAGKMFQFPHPFHPCFSSFHPLPSFFHTFTFSFILLSFTRTIANGQMWKKVRESNKRRNVFREFHQNHEDIYYAIRLGREIV